MNVAKASEIAYVVSFATSHGKTAILQIDQPKVSKILRGRLREFSTDRLFRFLNALDQDIQIVIKAKPSSRRQARMTVVPG